jgi:hypothetical protein
MDGQLLQIVPLLSLCHLPEGLVPALRQRAQNVFLAQFAALALRAVHLVPTRRRPLRRRHAEVSWHFKCHDGLDAIEHGLELQQRLPARFDVDVVGVLNSFEQRPKRFGDSVARARKKARASKNNKCRTRRRT